MTARSDSSVATTQERQGMDELGVGAGNRLREVVLSPQTQEPSNSLKWLAKILDVAVPIGPHPK
jgi:hypothetical protein